MKLKKILSFIFLFMFIIILSGCFKSNKPDVYAKSEIKGSNVLANLTFNIDSNNKTVKVKYNTYESEECKITFTKSNKVFIRETKNEIGIKSKYENEYFYYEIKLNDNDKQQIISLIKNDIEEETKDKIETNQDANNLHGFSITGIGLYIERHLYNGKKSDTTDDFYIPYISLETGSMIYNGDSSYKIIYA